MISSGHGIGAIDYPVDLDAPELEPWRNGNTGTDWVHTFAADATGPHVLLTAIVHGNEIAGAVALARLLGQHFRPRCGAVTMAFANVAAYQSFNRAKPSESRWVDEDLNRVWTDERLQGPRQTSETTRARALLPFVQAADFLLDLHTTQHPNEPMLLTGSLRRSAEFAAMIGCADLVIIDRGHAQGRRMRDYGAFGDPESKRTALLIECGQHWASASADVAYATCLRFLERLGVLPKDFEAGRVVPLPENPTRFVEITMAVTIKREFRFVLSLRGGEILREAGTLIGYDGDEPVVTPHDDCVVIMPSQRLWAGLTAVRLGRQVSLASGA
jgi:predicted deacylase